MADDWVSSSELAKAVGITRRAASKLARVALLTCRPWRGSPIEVEKRKAPGGASGTVFKIRLKSLPLDVQAAFKALGKPFQVTLPLGDKQARHARWWKAHVAPALAEPKGSNARGAAMRALAGKSLVGPDGVFITPSLRDVERKVAMLDAPGGEAGFLKKPRKGKGEKIVKLSRQWDALTVDMPEEKRAALVSATDRHVKSLWGNGAVYSVVRRLSAEKLADRTWKAGIDRPAAELVKLCTLPKHYLEHWSRRDLRRVHEHNTDAKSYDDSRSRVMLTSVDRMPMDLVFGDVHHFNILVLRSDGTVATPKGIAWLDAANRRVRIDLVLCEPGTAIRNEDLILSFVKMTQDPQWGLPKRLYLDNGSEYQFADLLEAALKLTRLGCDVAEWNSPVTRAQPHNAAAKGILAACRTWVDDVKACA